MIAANGTLPATPNQVCITVVTATHNAASTIERTLRSVRGQRHPRIEHIVIDGGSTDGTLAILERWKAGLARVSSAPDRGIYDAMNKGLGRMTGHLVCMLNADDWFASPEVCSRVAARYLEYAATVSPGCPHHVAIFGDFVMWFPRTGTASLRTARAGTRSGMRLNHQSLFIHRDVHREIGLYDLDCGLAGDFDLLIRMERAGVQMIRLPLPMTVFAKGGQGDRHFLRFLWQVGKVQFRHRGIVAGGRTLACGLPSLAGRSALAIVGALAGRHGERFLLARTLGARADHDWLPAWCEAVPAGTAAAAKGGGDPRARTD